MEFIDGFLALPASVAIYRIMVWYFGWLPLAVLYLVGAALLWRRYRRALWIAKHKFILLAIDVPENNEQSCKAVENLFTYLAGAHKSINIIEGWWQGMFQRSISMEIVGIDGYIQFLVHTPADWRNLIETAVYANYPDAEITEVEDYTKDAPSFFPNQEYDCWGTEFILSKEDMLPIKVYKEFEHQFGAPETHYRDPMASLMDLLSSLQRGEQVWYQILIGPTDFKWVKRGEELMNKIAGIKKKPKPSLLGQAVEPVNKVAGDLAYIVAAGWDPSREPGEAAAKKDEEKAEFNMMKLMPGQKKQIEGIQEKVSKMGFEVKIRMIYLAKRDVMNKPKVVNGFVGFIKQFNLNDLNGLKPDMQLTATSTAFLRAEPRVNIRKRKIMKAYRERDDVAGRNTFIMNSEELATLWHFPLDAVVKAPLIQRAAARRVEAPMSLPTGEQQAGAIEPIFEPGYLISDESATASSDLSDDSLAADGADQPPENLPFV